MGIWGAGIYENDDSADVRDIFNEQVASGVSKEDAIKYVVNKYQEFLVYDENFIFAVADLQVENNSVVYPQYVLRAKELASNYDASRYQDPAARKRAVQGLLTKLS